MSTNCRRRVPGVMRFGFGEDEKNEVIFMHLFCAGSVWEGVFSVAGIVAYLLSVEADFQSIVKLYA